MQTPFKTPMRTKMAVAKAKPSLSIHHEEVPEPEYMAPADISEDDEDGVGAEIDQSVTGRVRHNTWYM